MSDLRCQMSPELRLLTVLCIDRSMPDDGFFHHNKGFEWNRFFELCLSHKLGAVTYDQLKAANISLPNEIERKLHEHKRQVTVRNIALEAETAEVYSLLEREGIRSILFKGVASNKLLFPREYQSRFSSDIDLLVSPSDLQAVQNLMISSGFTPTKTPIDFGKKNSALLLRLLHAIPYVSPNLGTEIDLHHRLLLNPEWMPINFDRLHVSAENVQLSNTSVKTLGRAHLAYYSCCHVTDHRFYKLKWIEDAAKALQRAEERYEQFDLAKACELKPIPAIQTARQLIQELYRDSETKSPKDSNSKLTKKIVSGLENLNAPVETGILQDSKNLASRVIRRSALGGSFRATWFELMAALSSPGDVVLLRLGLLWQPLYMLVGPILLVGRYAKRRLSSRFGSSGTLR